MTCSGRGSKACKSGSPPGMGAHTLSFTFIESRAEVRSASVLSSQAIQSRGIWMCRPGAGVRLTIWSGAGGAGGGASPGAAFATAAADIGRSLAARLGAEFVTLLADFVGRSALPHGLRGHGIVDMADPEIDGPARGHVVHRHGVRGEHAAFRALNAGQRVAQRGTAVAHL